MMPTTPTPVQLLEDIQHTLQQIIFETLKTNPDVQLIHKLAWSAKHKTHAPLYKLKGGIFRGEDEH